MTMEAPGMFTSLTKRPTDPGMFERLGGNPAPVGVDTAIDEQRARQFTSMAPKLVDVCVEHYNLLDPEDVARYRKTHMEIVAGLTAGTHQLAHSERTLITTGPEPVLLHVIEYHVFERAQDVLFDSGRKKKPEKKPEEAVTEPPLEMPSDTMIQEMVEQQENDREEFEKEDAEEVADDSAGEVEPVPDSRD